MITLILIYLSTIRLSYTQDGHCAYFKYCGSGESSSKSLPSSSTSANFNPSNISNVKGLGLETLIQPNNSLGFNLVTGTGKIGGAIISPTAENSFFGNRSIEIDELYLQRRIEQKRYRNKKINLAIGGKIINQKNYGFDLGISVKRNPEIKKINPGLGFSLRLYFLNLGAHFYKDDTRIPLNGYYNPYTGELYTSQYNNTHYQETFGVKTFSIGTKIKNLSLDYGTINTQYEFYPEKTLIHIYSSAYSYNNFLFNFAYRKELSSNLKEEKFILSKERVKIDYYTGVQYFFNRHFIAGLGYNTYLLKEISATVTLFL